MKQPFLTRPESNIEWVLLFIAGLAIVGILVTIIGFTFCKLHL